MSELEEDDRLTALDELSSGLDFEEAEPGMAESYARARSHAPAPIQGPEYRPELMSRAALLPDDKEAPEALPAPAPAAAPAPPPRRNDSARLEALRALADGDASDERIREAAADERRQASMARASEALAAATRRAPVQYQTDTGPAASAVESQLAGRRDARKAALLKAMRGSDARPGVPAEYYQAQIDRWRAEDERKRLEAGTKADAAKAKQGASELAAATDASSLDAEKALLLKTPQAQRLRLTEKDLAGVKSRKGLESFTRVLNIKPPKAGPSAEAQAASEESERFELGRYRLTPRAGTKPDKYTRQKASEIAVPWGGALKAMDSLEGALSAYAANPGPDTAREVGSKVQTTAAAMNAAIGGGAMSEAELKNVSNALGADLTSPAGIQAFVESLVGNKTESADTLLKKLRAAREVNEAVLEGKLAGVNYVVERPKPAAPAQRPNTIRVRKKDGGQTGTIPAEKFDPSKYERIDG